MDGVWRNLEYIIGILAYDRSGEIKILYNLYNTRCKNGDHVATDLTHYQCPAAATLKDYNHPVRHS